MKICLVAEGSYPYIAGGVSSWVNQLMQNLPEFSFEVIAISPDRAHAGQSRYNFPANMKTIHNIFLDSLLENHNPRCRLKLSRENSEELRLLFLAKTETWPYLFKLFRNWQESGVRPHNLLLSRDFFDLISRICLEDYPRMSFCEVYWTMQSMYALVFALLLYRWPKADIYHAVSTGYAGLIAAAAADAHGGRMLLTEHGLYTREREEEIIKADWVRGYAKNIWIDYFASLARCSYSCAARVIALFERNSRLQQEMGCPAAKAMVIHNGIKADNFSNIAQQVRKRAANENLRIGAIVRVVPIKDIKTMLQAFSLVSSKIPQAEFIIMGPIDEEPLYYEECLSYKNQLNLRQAVFTGHVDIRSVLGSLDILVLSSISEGQPLAVLEGMACTLPFVCTDVGDCRMLLDNRNDGFGPAGRIVPIMDGRAMAEALLDLAGNFQLRRQMGEAGLKRVSRGYAFDDFISSYRQLYRQLGQHVNVNYTGTGSSDTNYLSSAFQVKAGEINGWNRI